MMYQAQFRLILLPCYQSSLDGTKHFEDWELLELFPSEQIFSLAPVHPAESNVKRARRRIGDRMIACGSEGTEEDWRQESDGY